MHAPIEIQKMLRSILIAICRKTPEPEIHFEAETGTFVVRVELPDQGRVIGVAGTVIWAISVMLHYAGIHHLGKPILLSIPRQPETGPRDHMPFEAQPDWDQSKLSATLESIRANIINSSRSGWRYEHEDMARAKIILTLPKKLLPTISEPSFEKAITVIVKAAGSAAGARLTTEVSWK